MGRISARTVSRLLAPATHVDLAAHNTFRCAATADEFVAFTAREQTAAVCQWLQDHRTALILGGGSNLLLATARVSAVLHVALRGLSTIHELDDRVVIEAAAGENWHALVLWSLNQGLAGLENLALIPGTVGAAPVQNIGAYGVEFDRVFEGLDALDITTGRIETMQSGDCGFSYRDSRFKREPHRWLILAVRLRLSRQPILCLDYGDIRKRLAEQGFAKPTPCDVANAVIAIRRDRLPDPAVLGNAGSFFRNPLVPAAQADALLARYPELPVWSVSPGQSKLAAGWLIERCGFKGARRGDAGVHERHALVLVNHGHATGAGLLALAREVQQAVRDRFEVSLEPEPLIVTRA